MMLPLGLGARGRPDQSTPCRVGHSVPPCLWQPAGTAGSSKCCVQLAASPVAPSLLMRVGSTQCHPGTGQDQC